jgi:hypothetical protein
VPPVNLCGNSQQETRPLTEEIRAGLLQG